MNDLQLGLMGAGAAAVLGVAAYNALQYAKIRRALSRMALSSDSGHREEKRPDELSAQVTAAWEHNETEPLSMIDTRIDCVVPLYLEMPVPAEKVMALMHRLRHAGSKPVFIEGQTEADGWQTIRAGSRYQALRIAVQCANRSGPLNEVEFSEFVVGVQTLADALDADMECPDMTETVARARELDAFIARCDQQLSIQLISEHAPWAACTVQRVAAQDGLTLSRDGFAFIRQDRRQHPIFVLQLGDINFLRDDLSEKSSGMIRLLLDVPLADPEIQPFQKMIEYAHTLAKRLGAQVVDDRRQPLSEAALREIEVQLSILYETLDAAGLPAGSSVSWRLFGG